MNSLVISYPSVSLKASVMSAPAMAHTLTQVVTQVARLSSAQLKDERVSNV